MSRIARKVAHEIAHKLAQMERDPHVVVCEPTLQRWFLMLSPPKKKRAKDPARASRRATVKELDALCRKIVFARDGGRCQWSEIGAEICGHADGLMDWAHILSRRHLKVRHDPENSVVLCRRHHMLFHDRPVEAAAWLKRARPGLYERLVQRNGGPGRADNRMTRLFLESEARKMGLEV